MVKNIKKVAVLGSGIMGSGIACHLANVGIEVLLLDIIPENFKTSQNKNERNSIVNKALTAAVKSKPSPLYAKNKLSNITTRLKKLVLGLGPTILMSPFKTLIN